MTETDTPKSARKPRWTPLEMGLFTVVSLFLIIIVILMVLFATQSNEICTTADCTHSASRLIQNMDASVDPCDNFYQYACGGWLKKNVIPETSSRYGVYDILNSNLEVILKGVLEKKVDKEAAAFTKAKTLYNSCINEKLIEQKGGRPLFDMLPDIFDWPIAVDNWETVYGKTWRLEDVLARLNWKYATDVLVSFIVDNDDRDSTSHIIYFDQQTTFGLWSKDHYTCKGRYAKACEVYEQFMFDLAKLIRTDRGLKFNEAEIKAEVKRVVDLEKDIINATDPPEFRRDPMFLYNRIELGTLNRIFSFEIDSQRFNWSYFTAKIMDNVNIKVPESEKIINYSPRYYGKLKNVLAKYTKRDLQNYVVWRFLMKMVRALSRAYRNTRNYFLQVQSGATSEDTVWRRCALLVNRNLDNAVGRLYVQEAFSDNSKQLMEELIKDIREVFISNLNDLSWMDEKTKKAAEEKARAIRQRIGYSEDIMNDEYLNNEYKDLNFSAEEYFKNILHSMEHWTKKDLQKLREKVNKNKWSIGAAVINAFYSANSNEIVFPAGILQPPFFSKGQPKSLNYGGIGMVIGHEIVHGFDDIGRSYDKDGKLKVWWTPGSTKKFLDLSRCIANQYSRFSWDLADGLHLNGDITLNENIADNGGIRLAYQAYKKFVKRNGEELPLPGIDLSHDQLFFLNFAQIWCESYRPEQAINSIEMDVHSPMLFRVLGSLQNFPEFAKAFNCKKSSNMVSDNVCRVW
ncbi:neprilysin-like [Poeciliopsis prolifica]|uniref:neprilysin-like n=1 Tax=Poeciliopsis prolifica TaxID=188132 RepID=UPI0024134648|nr:neprilysin-like [Poeciliopsis prolifica]XP_054901745.1 neprilysin-like [Poeciliopsis prolifica]